MPTLHIHISGKVQGVGYRAAAHATASQLGLTGWVKNLPDGRVAILAQGDQTPLEQLIAWCQQGPRFAHVTAVEVSVSAEQTPHTGFELRR